MLEYKPSLTGIETLHIVALCEYYLTAYLQAKNTENLDATLLPLSSDRAFFISDPDKRLTISDTEITY